jgi:hypothetical protein
MARGVEDAIDVDDGYVRRSGGVIEPLDVLDDSLALGMGPWSRSAHLPPVPDHGVLHLLGGQRRSAGAGGLVGRSRIVRSKLGLLLVMVDACHAGSYNGAGLDIARTSRS